MLYLGDTGLSHVVVDDHSVGFTDVIRVDGSEVVDMYWFEHDGLSDEIHVFQKIGLLFVVVVGHSSIL